MPYLSLTAISTCEGELTGSVELLGSNSGTLYKIDAEVFTDELPMDLGVGLYTLYFSGCIDSIPFEIGGFTNPNIYFDIVPAFEVSDGGMITVANTTL